ncbi:Josephin-domain-containing protein [Schizophyllum commune]
MATLDDLVPLIYHEKQQPGSMLCAQHALNALLRECCTMGRALHFTAPDLSEHARQLDDLEMSYDDDNTGTTSTNMDDTGFFSVQVLDRAVDVWNLTLTRWRSEEMRTFQDHPEAQIAFIFNQNQHWYTLRRFGDLTVGSTSGHWFDLNSFNESPQWVSKLYLGMFIQQAETEGYSVFVVRQKNPNAPIEIPRTDADELARAVPENASAPRASSTRMPGGDHKSPFGHIEGLEDEDMELQAALQASLGGAYHEFDVPFNRPGPAAQSFASRPIPGGLVEEEDDDDEWDRDDMHDVVDTSEPGGSVETSAARNQRLLAQMQREQRMAQQELLAAGGGRPNREYEEEEEMLRRAIAESEAMARAQGHSIPDDNEDEDVSHTPAGRPPAIPPATTRPAGHRVYDDEDAELQAALKASMEGLPEGWTPPPEFETRTPAAPPPPVLAAASSSLAPPAREEDEKSEASFDASSDAPEPAPAPSVDEIRRMRLARFGGS